MPDYMNERQLAFFKQRLLALRAETLEEVEAGRWAIATVDAADELDRAAAEYENRQRLRF